MTGIALLPPETLSNIFMLAVGPIPYPDMKEAPINVSQTCRLWREILLNDGRFWSSFQWQPSDEHLEEEDYQVANPEDVSVLAVLWLQRSGNANLRCRFSFEDFLEPGNQSQSDHLLSALCAKQTSWESMTILYLHYSFCALVLSNLPRVTHLEISTLKEGLIVVDNHAAGTRADSVASFVINTRASYIGPLAPQLTSLSLGLCSEDVDVEGVLALLQQSPKLVSLSISSHDMIHHETLLDFESELDFFDPDERIIMHNLRRLHYKSANAQSRLLAWFQMPRLQELYLDAWTAISTDDEEKTYIVDFLNRSKAPIRLALFNAVPLSDSFGIKLLEALSTVERLAFGVRSGAFLDAFVDEMRPTLLCPRMKKLQLSLNPMERLDVITTMLQKRTHMFPDFQAFIVVPRGLDDAALQLSVEALSAPNIVMDVTVTRTPSGCFDVDVYDEGMFARFEL